MAKSATERDVRFYGCLIMALLADGHWAAWPLLAIAGWALYLDLRDSYREEMRRHGSRR